jgi:hypothetical protein
MIGIRSCKVSLRRHEMILREIASAIKDRLGPQVSGIIREKSMLKAIQAQSIPRRLERRSPLVTTKQESESRRSEAHFHFT